jgi:hypothetical protein
MHQSGSFMLVRADKLAETPQAFQDYVKDFFVLKNIFGMDCYVAIQTLSLEIWDGSGHRNKTEGIAPSHNCDVQRYKDGLPEGKRLFEWIYEAKKAGIIFTFYNSWDDGCCGYPIDYD